MSDYKCKANCDTEMAFGIAALCGMHMHFRRVSDGSWTVNVEMPVVRKGLRPRIRKISCNSTIGPTQAALSAIKHVVEAEAAHWHGVVQRRKERAEDD